MKKYARKLSLVLTLVLIMTSFGYTGAFAGENDSTDGAVLDQVETEEQAEEQTEEPAADEPAGEQVEEKTEEPAVDEKTEEQAEEKTEEPVVDEETEEAVEETAEDAEEELFEAKAAKTFTITWENADGTVLEVDEEVAEGTVPEYNGETPKKETEKYVYKFTGWDPEPEAATKDATYTAVFKKSKSKNVKPAAPSVKTYSSFKSIALEWKAVTRDKDGVTYTDTAKKGVKYRVRFKKGKDGKFSAWKDVGTKTKFHTPKPYNLDPLKTYYFEVQAYITVDGEKKYSEAATEKDSPVRPIRYKLYVKQGTTLTSHYKYDYKKDKYTSSSAGRKTVKSGQYIYADRFATGRYIFTDGKYVYFISRTRLGSKSCEYTKKWNYSKKEMEYFANDKGVKSKTKYLIMVSQYTQHVYVLEGKKSGTKYKNWKIKTVAKNRNNKTLKQKKYAHEKDLKKGAAMHWECGTGTASDPTPTSQTGLKQIGKKMKVEHRIPWWSGFHGHASFHGNKILTNDRGLGAPVSTGCVRNPHERAHLIYDLCKKGTQVVIY